MEAFEDITINDQLWMIMFIDYVSKKIIVLFYCKYALK